MCSAQAQEARAVQALRCELHPLHAPQQRRALRLQEQPVGRWARTRPALRTAISLLSRPLLAVRQSNREPFVACRPAFVTQPHVMMLHGEARAHRVPTPAETIRYLSLFDNHYLRYFKGHRRRHASLPLGLHVARRVANPPRTGAQPDVSRGVPAERRFHVGLPRLHRPAVGLAHERLLGTIALASRAMALRAGG
jgi:hypothetical protein